MTDSRASCESAEPDANRLWGQPNASPYVKDAFHEYVVSGKRDAVNPTKTGTKAAEHYVLEVLAGQSKIVRLRLSAKRVADGLALYLYFSLAKK